MSWKTVLGIAAVAFTIWWIIEQPLAAAHLVHNIGTFLSTAGAGMQRFLRNA
ncbi:MAG: hypothetical protein ACRDRJ_22925 [Streptosporangiaceae bacterium]